MQQLEAVGGSAGDVATSEDASPEPANGAFSFFFRQRTRTRTARHATPRNTHDTTRHDTRHDTRGCSKVFSDTKQGMPRGVTLRRWSTSR